jgi:hypothetical protein
MKSRALMWILWPSFLVAAATSATVFAMIDPLDIQFLGHIEVGRQVVYGGAFFLFWLMAALSSALTLFIGPRALQVDEFGDTVV